MLSFIDVTSVNGTGQEMRRLVENYHTDAAKFDNMSLEAAFNIVKNLPYKADRKEVLHRPAFILSDSAIYRDCDDKSILLGSILYRKKIPFRFVAVSGKPDKKLHHVLIIAKVNNENKVLDATYPQNEIFKYKKKVTAVKPITDWVKK